MKNTSLFTKNKEGNRPGSVSPYHSVAKKWLTILVICSILGAGAAGAAYLKKTAPKPTRKKPENKVVLVEVEQAEKTSEQVIVKAMGTVIPSRQIDLKPLVGGQLVAFQLEFIEGGLFKEGEKIVQIDPTDYQLNVARKQSNVASALYAYKLELGEQDVAKREWELFDSNKTVKDLDEELALRKPHLFKAEAELVAAEAELNQAKLDLFRTTLAAPFNALVLSKNVDMGSSVSAQDQLATLVGTDEFWIQVAIPLDRLKWISIPGINADVGSEVVVTYGSDEEQPNRRKGTIIKLLGDLETEGRMARLLVSVTDPLDLHRENNERSPLLLGEYVRIEVLGSTLADVVAIPRSAIHDGSKVWIAGLNNSLEIREVRPVWQNAENVFLQSGIEENEQIITSDIATAVESMKIAFNQQEELDDQVLLSATTGM